jgi:cyclopropane fatty-acyl-phospholipid synthase-like methyltransferase
MNRFRRHFFFWIQSFGHPRWDTRISPPELLTHLRTASPGRAIDLGCGTGTNVITLAQHGWDATGVDFIHHNIDIAMRRAKEAGVMEHAHFRCDSVARLNGIHGPFDLALDMGCYHGLTHPDRASYREKLAETLAPGGTYLLYGMIHTGETNFGFDETDMREFCRFLTLRSRVDSTDHNRESSWWIFQKP